MSRAHLVLPLILCTIVTGCATTNGRFGFSRTTPEAVPRDVQAIADRFNANSSAIRSIQCNYVTVDGKATDGNGRSTPYTLDAMMAFEKPGNFRMKGLFAGRPEVDLGANNNEIWFWVKRMEPGKVFYLPRTELEQAQLNMPFQPDWIAEVLGANEINPRDYRWEATQGNLYCICSECQTPSGRVIKRLIFDKSRKDRLYAIRVHSWATEKPIAQAIIDEYWEDPETGLYCPRVVRMNWPDAGTQMTVKLRRNTIQFNGIETGASQVLFARDGLSDKEPINLASMRQLDEQHIRQETNYRPQGNPVVPASGIELGSPRPITRQ